MLLIAALLFGLLVVGLLVYVVREATVLKTTAAALQGELTQFKQGGFQALVRDVLQQDRQQLLEQQQRATRAAEQFNQSLGAIATQISSLNDLQVKVSELNDLLKPQQLRGELGEVIVRTLIADKLPPSHYEENHTFADGKKVEFVITLNDRLIPIDSKLQLEDYKRMREAPEERRGALRTEFKRTVKQKIDEVKAYIRPEEGTYNFALMVIPSEAVYYDLIASRDFTEAGGLYDYARAQHVFVVSPLTFWAYLTAIAQGLQGLEVGRRAEDILASLQTLASHIRDFSHHEFRLIGDHLRNATTNYDEAKEKLQQIEEGLTTLERFDAQKAGVPA